MREAPRRTDPEEGPLRHKSIAYANAKHRNGEGQELAQKKLFMGMNMRTEKITAILESNLETGIVLIYEKPVCPNIPRCANREKERKRSTHRVQRNTPGAHALQGIQAKYEP